MHKIHILPDDIHLEAEPGTLISKVIQDAGINITYPCGGRGTCGRCMVYANGAAVRACVTEVQEDLEIQIPDIVRLSGQNVLTDIRLYEADDNVLPRVEQITVRLEEPTLDDSMSDAGRLQNAVAAMMELPLEKVRLEPSLLKVLPKKLRESNFEIQLNLIHENDGITILSVGDGPLYGLAVDIGTTTVVTALCDLKTGFVLDTVGISNPQAEYGSDVISRIVYTEENKGGADLLQKVILDALSDSIRKLAEKAKINPESIPVMTIGANTVMCHLLLNLPADYLRREPYVPAVSQFPPVRPMELGLPILPAGRVLVLPAISSYVGGDITAGVIATKLHEKEGLNLLVDVGTNGEMVLAGEGFLIACSSSAGPAFEGSGISCGSRAVKGAIDNVIVDGDGLKFEVIGGDDVEPASVCGSGLISLLSALLKKGVINRAGRFSGEEKSFSLTDKVTITEADIANLIRAKGAIFAGLHVLITHMELDLSMMDHIYIAGGFGRNINIGDSIKIGMFPPLEDENYSYVGNTSLTGALRVLNDRTVDGEEIAASILNLELSVGNEFMEEFTKACFLPHTELTFERA